MGNCIIDKVGTVIMKQDGFTIAANTPLESNQKQPWDENNLYRWH